MSDNSKILIVGALVVGYMMMTRRPMGPGGYAAGPKSPYAVGTMPGSAGVGWEQVGISALSGFLKGLAGGFNNSSQSYIPSLYNQSQATTDYMQSGTVQDVANDYVFDPMSSAESVGSWWA